MLGVGQLKNKSSLFIIGCSMLDIMFSFEETHLSQQKLHYWVQTVRLRP